MASERVSEGSESRYGAHPVLNEYTVGRVGCLEPLFIENHSKVVVARGALSRAIGANRE